MYMSEERNTETNDILTGSMLKNILFFVWPIMLANILQISFHFADTIVIGNYASQQGLAAVGTTGPITVFFMWGLNGLSMGANVLVSRMIGAKKHDQLKQAVFTSVLIGFVFGFCISLIGVVFAEVMLRLLGTPSDIMADATLYLRIYFLCGVAFGVFDFCSSILRANGDTSHPTLYLAIGGAMNVLLNLLFVVVFRMNVAGVALATLISQYSSAFLSFRRLLKEESMIHLDLNMKNYDPELMKQVLRYGIPSALQNQMFSFSNMIVQSSINSFGSTFVAANTASNAIEEYVYVFVDAFPLASLTFTSQLYGAGEYKRIRKMLVMNFVMCGVGAFLIGLIILMNGTSLMSMVADDPEVIRMGLIRLRYVTFFLFLNGLLDVIVNGIRGIGLANLPTIITLFGVCGFRALYIYTYFRLNHTPEVLYSCFPLSWALTLIVQSVIWFISYRRLLNEGQ